jgi:hypothetical protein
VTAKDAAALLAGKTTGEKKCRSKQGKEFKAAFYIDENHQVCFRFATKKGHQ